MPYGPVHKGSAALGSGDLLPPQLLSSAVAAVCSQALGGPREGQYWLGKEGSQAADGLTLIGVMHPAWGKSCAATTLWIRY